MRFIFILLLLTSHAWAIKVEVVSLKGFDPLQDLRFRAIAAKTEQVINSKDFQDGVESFSYQGKAVFTDSLDTPTTVFKTITTKDWSLEYRMEKLFSRKTIGYTLPTVTWIAFNSRFWYKLQDAEISANICHEYGGHKFGRYSHASKWSKSRDYSVPYFLGSLCEKIYLKRFK